MSFRQCRRNFILGPVSEAVMLCDSVELRQNETEPTAEQSVTHVNPEIQ